VVLGRGGEWCVGGMEGYGRGYLRGRWFGCGMRRVREGRTLDRGILNE
jgi:hypothetical protein